MTTSTYTDLTLTKARQLAKRARQHGHFRGEPGGRPEFGYRVGWVNCPECHDKVVGWSDYPHKVGGLMRALDSAMVAHLTSGDCAVHPDRASV